MKLVTRWHDTSALFSLYSAILQCTVQCIVSACFMHEMAQTKGREQPRNRPHDQKRGGEALSGVL